MLGVDFCKITDTKRIAQPQAVVNKEKKF